MIRRDSYMKQLIEFKDKKLIKVITGMRRCGKSTLLDMFEEELIKVGISVNSIIRINFESMKYDQIKDYNILYNYLLERIDKESRTYILLDEIQQVEGWEKAINSLTLDYDTDIYLTGSNAYLLSSELSTLLSGRYVEIKMLPFSFKEYISAEDGGEQKTLDEKFESYLKYGGLPAVINLDQKDSVISMFLSGIYHTVVMKDIVQRNAVKDIALLENVIRFVLHNIGSTVSPKKISDFINSEGRKTTSETIDNYLHMLEKAYIFYSAGRFDIKGKQYLKTLKKYYIADMGLRNAILGYRDTDYGHVVENIVYLELIRRGYKVSIGKYYDFEIDFIAENQSERIYFQVTASLLNEAVAEREFRGLEAIPDHFEKRVITMDKSFLNTKNGIKCQNVIEFLLEDRQEDQS